MSGMDQKLNCLIVDDEPHAIKILELYIEKTPFLEVAATTTSPWEAMEILKKESINLLFLDIQMEGLTGLQLLDLAGKTCPGYFDHGLCRICLGRLCLSSIRLFTKALFF